MTISNFVAYVKQAWKNKPDTSTPLSAARLTHLEDGIKGNSDAIEKIAAAVVSQIANDPNKIASMAALYSVNQAVTQLNSDLGVVAAGTSTVKNIGTAVQYLSGFTSSDVETDCLKPVESGVYIKKDGIYLIVIRFALSGCANNNLTYGHRQYISTNDYVDSFDYDYCDHSESFNRTQVRTMKLKAGYYLRPLVGGSAAVGRCTAASMSVMSIKSAK